MALPEGRNVACASSGTSALIGAILAKAGHARPKRNLALLPSFTFIATAAAAEQCGYLPCLADVDSISWLLNPDQIISHPLLDRIGVVVPVAAFGRPVHQAPWIKFQQQTGIPVVIDGAASTDSLLNHSAGLIGAIPVAMSFHATKAFATGEGGGIVSSDPLLIARMVQTLNFGMETARDSMFPGINGKMSEFHAAVGLAELDGWKDKYTALSSVSMAYRCQLAQTGIEGRYVGTPDVSGAYSLFMCNDRCEAESIQRSLTSGGINWRLWYGTGLHNQTCYATLPRSDLSVTDAIAPLILGIPMAPDLTSAAIKRVGAALHLGIRRSY